MLWVAVTGDRQLAGPQVCHHHAGGSVQVAAMLFSFFFNGQVQTAGGFRRAQNHRARAEQTGSYRALHGVGCCGQRHSGRLHAGHQAVFGNCHQGGVQHRTGGSVSATSGNQQKEIVTEVDVPDQVARQVSSTNHDGVFVGGADGRAGHGSLADFQNKSPGSG